MNVNDIDELDRIECLLNIVSGCNTQPLLGSIQALAMRELLHIAGDITTAQATQSPPAEAEPEPTHQTRRA